MQLPISIAVCPSNTRYRLFCTLVIIFVHYVAISFYETIKLPKEMPKMPKVEVFYLFNRKDRATCRVVAEGEA